MAPFILQPEQTEAALAILASAFFEGIRTRRCTSAAFVLLLSASNHTDAAAHAGTSADEPC